MTDAEAVSREIRSRLRRNEGLVAKKFTECPTVLEALGTTDPLEAHERFVTAIERLPDDKYTAALKNAFRLDKSLKENVSARRGIFSVTYSVSEETVKSWELRAIEALAQILISRPEEVLDELFIMFIADGHRVAEMHHGYMWRSVTGSSQRLEVKKWANPGKVGFSFAVYQVASDERPQAIDIVLLFDNREPPQGAWIVPGVDFLTFMACAYTRIAADGPKPALDLIPGYPYADDPDDRNLQEYVGYQKRWLSPMPGDIYGIAWW
jgi:hypothetical protein